jgi:hypothetical protein
VPDLRTGLLMATNTDLPAGYRWATEEECEDWENVPGIISVPRTADINGVPYTQGEADLAVPKEAH